MSGRRKRRCNVDDDDEDDSLESGVGDVVLEVTFIDDDDCAELLYKDGSVAQIRAGWETPKNNRVARLRETPPGKRQMSPRLASGKLASVLDNLSEEEEDSEEGEKVEPLKPTTLFLDTNDSPTGARLPNSKKNKERMLQKAKESREKYFLSQPNEETTPQKRSKSDSSTPKSKQKTPQSKQSTPKNNVPKTPRIQQQNIKKNLKSVMAHCDDGSDDSDWSEESDDSDTDDNESDTSTAPPTPRQITPNKVLTPKSTPTMGLRTRYQHAKYKSEDYFTLGSSSKVVTSDKTLSMLENPRLSADTVQQTLKQIAVKHQQEIRNTIAMHIAKFDHWMCLLYEGFNLILHGFGSKIVLLQQFHDKMLRNEYDSLIINGYFTGLTLRDILKSIAEDITEMTGVVGDEGELCDLLVSWYNSPHASPLFLLVNNLDGGVFQSNKSQNILSRLAAAQNIHLIATIDHCSAALLFDQSQLSKYNFVWQDVTNFLPYTEENSFESSLLVQRSGGIALASLGSVFQSLNSNARAIYLLVMNRQLETSDSKYMGISFTELYQVSREQFIVSTDSNLRSHLTEFRDHKLMVTKRGPDGAELLYIPIPRATLVEFKNSQEE